METSPKWRMASVCLACHCSLSPVCHCFLQLQLISVAWHCCLPLWSVTACCLCDLVIWAANSACHCGLALWPAAEAYCCDLPLYLAAADCQCVLSLWLGTRDWQISLHSDLSLLSATAACDSGLSLWLSLICHCNLLTGFISRWSVFCLLYDKEKKLFQMTAHKYLKKTMLIRPNMDYAHQYACFMNKCMLPISCCWWVVCSWIAAETMEHVSFHFPLPPKNAEFTYH